VGVAKNSRFLGVTAPIDAFFYLPYLQHSDDHSQMTVQVRTAGPPAPMIPQVEGVVTRLTPDLPMFDVETMFEALNTLAGLLIFKIGAALAAALGMMGLVLAVVGVYGVISYATSQRTREIGIRMALGAQSAMIAQMILRQGIGLIGFGLTVGVGGAFVVTRLVSNFVAVSATDPITYLTVSAGLASIALLACVVPAMRAAQVDPLVAFKHE
jgi:predicted lysophospholipase L1 biosynthesis ABC-type transport system permease subunit